MDGIDFISLHFGAEDSPRPEGLRVVDNFVSDFADAAGAYELLDLVVTVDSAPCHLAGALGRPVWTMLPRGSDFRWGMSGRTTPWYPTMTLYRQNTLGYYTDVYERLERDLKAAAERKNSEE